MSECLGPVAEALAALVTLGVAAATVVLAPGGQRVAAAGIAVALAWSCASLFAALLGRRPRDGEVRRVELPAAGGTASVTTIVRVGDEPAEIARSTVALAGRAGPTIVVATDPTRVEGLASLAESVHTDPDIAAAVREAARVASTEAVLLVSARAVPRTDVCARAATLLDDETGWVSGTTVPLTRDQFVSNRREVVGAALRRRSVSDLVLWESDATLVRRDLLAEHELGSSHSWGTWLRARAGDGVRGCSIDDALAMRAAPVAADSYWPDALARQRAVAVDLAGAVGTGARSARLDALLLLLRELWAYPVTLLAVCLVLIGGHAGGVELLGLVAALGVSAALRWAALRVGLGVDLRARADATSAIYHLPGSYSALPAAITRRVRPVGRAWGTRPLVWGALALTLVTGALFVGGATAGTGTRVAAALCLVTLGLLWAFAVRSLVERSWQRRSYRVRLQLAATLDGEAVTTVDGSPGGVAVAGRFTATLPAVGDEVDLEIRLDDGTALDISGVVADRRSTGGRTQLGIELHGGSNTIGAWSAQLLRAAATQSPSADLGGGRTGDAPQVDHERHRTPRAVAVTVLHRLLSAVVVVASLLVAAALVLVLLGFRPYVIRSGSMIPTYGVGDIVLVEQVRADQLRPGDVASLEYYAPTGEGLTHRIREIRHVGDDLEFETRGDANEHSETWTERPDALVGKVVASIPAIGAIATSARTATVPMLALVGVIALAVVALLFLRRPGPPTPGPSTPDLASDDPVSVDPASAERAPGGRPGR